MTEISGNFMDSTTREEKLNYYHDKAWEDWHREQLREYLEEEEDVITGTNIADRFTDFYVGDVLVYPERFDDDHMNVVGRSSLAFRTAYLDKRDERKFVSEMNVHLPPAREHLKAEINDVLEVEDFEDVVVYWGSGALGGIPAPDGVITPHVVHTDNLTIPTVIQVLERVVEAYKTVYDNGEKAIKRHPEDL